MPDVTREEFLRLVLRPQNGPPERGASVAQGRGPAGEGLPPQGEPTIRPQIMKSAPNAVPLEGIERPQGVRPRGLARDDSVGAGAHRSAFPSSGLVSRGHHLLMKPGPCENAAEIAKALVARLGSDDWEERRFAHAELAVLMLRCPAEVEPVVDEATKQEDPEVQARARRLQREVPWTRLHGFLNSLVARKTGRGQLQVITTREVLSNPCLYWEEMRKVESPILFRGEDTLPGFLSREEWFAALDELDDICNREFSAELTREKAARVASFLTRLRLEMEE